MTVTSTLKPLPLKSVRLTPGTPFAGAEKTNLEYLNMCVWAPPAHPHPVAVAALRCAERARAWRPRPYHPRSAAAVSDAPHHTTPRITAVPPRLGPGWTRTLSRTTSG